jgi:hypothetical protein
MNTLLIVFFISYAIYSFFNTSNTFLLLFLFFVLIYFYLTQIQLGAYHKEFLRRKITIATWSDPFDPQTYTQLKLNVTKIIPYLEKKSTEINSKITVTVFTVKLMAIILKKFPEVYGYIKLGRYEQKNGVDICCLVNVGDGKELANTTIKNCERKNFKTICDELFSSANLLKKTKNKDQNKKMKLMYLLPTFLLGPLIQISSYLSSIGVALELIGLKKFEFGSCVITSIGSLGIENSFAPIPPLTFTPMLLTLCKTYNKNYLKNGKIEEKTFLTMNFTSDFRFFDINAASGIFKEIKRIGEDPDVFEEECRKCEEDCERKENRRNSFKK